MPTNFFSNIKVAPGFIANSTSNKNHKNRKLIVVQFSGGNDGLNTIIPYTNQLYYKNRRSIAIPKKQQIIMDDDIAFHHALKKFADLFNQGCVQIINDVGYPNRTRSHFKSMDIWHSANAETSSKNSGWLGRYLDATCNNENHNMFRAIQVSDLLSLALKGKTEEGIAFDDFDELISDIKKSRIDKLQNVLENDNFKQNENLHYLYNVLHKGNAIAKPIYEKYKKLKIKLNFPKSKLGSNLKNVAELILSDIDTQIYYVTHGTFDTHSNQIAKQNKLLQDFSNSIYSLVNTLKTNNKFDDVCILVFSEFGRRVKENASNGTDHGTANNLYLISNFFKRPGFFNEINNMQNLLSGDLDYKIDFRQIYASILEDWFKVDHKKVLNQKFKKLNIFEDDILV